MVGPRLLGSGLDLGLDLDQFCSIQSKSSIEGRTRTEFDSLLGIHSPEHSGGPQSPAGLLGFGLDMGLVLDQFCSIRSKSPIEGRTLSEKDSRNLGLRNAQVEQFSYGAHLLVGGAPRRLLASA